MPATLESSNTEGNDYSDNDEIGNEKSNLPKIGNFKLQKDLVREFEKLTVVCHSANFHLR